MFDDYLRAQADRSGKPFVPFDMPDYLRYIDGKPRADGVRSLLEARRTELPEGSPGDPAGSETVQGLGNRKNELVLKIMEDVGVEAFEGSRRYLDAVQDAGMKRAVVSASTNTPAVLEASGLAGRFDAVVDGTVALRKGLRGKPFADTFLFAARALDVDPAAAAVFEDALAGVKAGREGGFGFVVGVDRSNQAPALLAEGAHVVVKDLAELLEDR
ncbi:MAG TPA: HAD-IA family hydrolase [Actinomycetota bacterium]|nr:HAD-IA family hydrolase [Actinomycetota bacterium]